MKNTGEVRLAQIVALKFPWVRAELSAHLKSAATIDIFEKTSEVEFIVHFFFDDHDFYPDASREVGYVLIDDREASVITGFVSVLDQAIGPKTKPLSKLRKEDWEPVAIAAEQTLAALTL